MKKLFLLLTLVGMTGAAYSQNSAWPFPRHDSKNTSAQSINGIQPLSAPTVLWDSDFMQDTNISSVGSFYPVAADIDNDGEIEFVTGGRKYSSPQTYFLYAVNCNDGSLLWTRQIGSWYFWATPVIADINADGQLDIVVGTEDSVIALNASDASTLWKVPGYLMSMGMTVGNLDNDSALEIVQCDYNSPRGVWLLDGTNGSVIWKKTTDGSAYNIPAIDDIDGDGDNEILLHSHTGSSTYAGGGFNEKEYCFDKNGNILWTFLGEPTATQNANAPVEVGYAPNAGYISTSIADFDSDGNKEVAWADGVRYYMLDQNGNLIWSVPLRNGHGVGVVHHNDGTYTADNLHPIGGPSGYSQAIGDLNGDGILEVVLSLWAEYRRDYYDSTGVSVYSNIIPGNKVVVLNGQNGSPLWEFKGDFYDPDSMDYMNVPILADVDGDNFLDVLAGGGSTFSNGTTLYAINGLTGNLIWSYRDSTSFGQLTYIKNNNQGILLFSRIKYDSLWNPLLRGVRALLIGNYITTSLNEEEFVLFNIRGYPNPTKENFVIEISDPCVDRIEISLFDMHGKCVVKQKKYSVINKQCILNLNRRYDAGNYLMIIKIKGKEYAEKVIIH